MTVAAYYERTPTGYRPTEYVTGPWNPDHCHAGPPAAILVGEIVAATPGMGVTRISFEIPRGIPKVPCAVRIEDLRPGKRIRLVRATLVGPDEDVLMAATAWCIRIAEEPLPEAPGEPIDVPLPDACEPLIFPFRDEMLGYMDGVEMRTAEGTPFGGGPAAIWIRQTIPLVDGEEEHPLTRLGLFGDLGNGISAIARFDQLIAVNTDLTLYVARAPESAWVGMRSRTVTSGRGLGMTDSLVYDASGFAARANQSIYFGRPGNS